MSFPVFLLLIFLFKSDLSKSEADTRNIIIPALEKATFFLANKYRDINLDAVLGFRILQAHLKGALEKWASKRKLPSQQAQVKSLVKKLSSLIEKASHSLGQSDPEYFKEFEPILGPHFWMLPRSWNQTDASLAYSTFDNVDCFTEERSDKCFTYLLGTWKGNGKSCTVTETCRNIMTKFGCSDYSLSHQLFYFMIADMNLGSVLGSSIVGIFFLRIAEQSSWWPGAAPAAITAIIHSTLEFSRLHCLKGCSDHLFLEAQYYRNIFCASMMKINLVIESNGFRFSSRDLFMENIMFCGMSGFSDFFKPSWLETILTWQKPEEGCFGKPSEDFEHSFRVKDQEQLLRRVKRREKVFADGCSSHNTAVAVGVLGGFLYYY